MGSLNYLEHIQTRHGAAWHEKEQRRITHEWNMWSGIGKTREELTADDLESAERINNAQCDRIEKELENAKMA